MDWNKVKIEISFHDHNIGVCITEGEKTIDWNELTREEQLKILDGISSGHSLFSRFVKNN